MLNVALREACFSFFRSRISADKAGPKPTQPEEGYQPSNDHHAKARVMRCQSDKEERASDDQDQGTNQAGRSTHWSTAQLPSPKLAQVYTLLLAKKLRQLRHVGRNPARLVARVVCGLEND